MPRTGQNTVARWPGLVSAVLLENNLLHAAILYTCPSRGPERFLPQPLAGGNSARSMHSPARMLSASHFLIAGIPGATTTVPVAPLPQLVPGRSVLEPAIVFSTDIIGVILLIVLTEVPSLSCAVGTVLGSRHMTSASKFAGGRVPSSIPSVV